MKAPHIPHPKKVSSHFPAEVKQETRRLTGVTPGLLHNYQESPARFLPKIKGGIHGLAGAKRIK